MKNCEKKEVEKRFFSAKEIAMYLGLTQDAIRKWVKKGMIPFCKLNGAIRFDIYQINTWINKSSHAVI